MHNILFCYDTDIFSFFYMRRPWGVFIGVRLFSVCWTTINRLPQNKILGEGWVRDGRRAPLV